MTKGDGVSSRRRTKRNQPTGKSGRARGDSLAWEIGSIPVSDNVVKQSLIDALIARQKNRPVSED